VKYYPHTGEDVQRMLSSIGCSSVEELFSSIPGKYRIDAGTLPDDGMWEEELRRVFTGEYLSSPHADLRFLGGGCYEHFIPSIVDHITGRGEFATAYTPYQPEASQGTLQTIFEYQSMMCELTGMDVSNASHYDAATAAADAVLMMRAAADGPVFVSAGVNPAYRDTINTYLKAAAGMEVGIIPLDSRGETAQAATIGSCIVVQQPNVLGCVEDIPAIAAAAHNLGAKLIVIANPMALGWLEAPGKQGADAVVGDTQPFGLPMTGGGESAGFFCVTRELIRRLPGRLIGQAKDAQGRDGFVLTLQAREQHIRREKATSNICSNQALNALRTTVYLSWMGKTGLSRVARRNADNAAYLAEGFERNGIPLLFPETPFFNEFAVRVSNPERVVARLREKGIEAGIPLGSWFPGFADALLVCTTEVHSAADLDRFIAAMKEVCHA